MPKGTKYINRTYGFEAKYRRGYSLSFRSSLNSDSKEVESVLNCHRDLTADEYKAITERILAKQVTDDDRQRLILSVVRMVYCCAAKIASRTKEANVLDAFGEYMTMLMARVDNFNPSRASWVTFTATVLSSLDTRVIMKVRTSHAVTLPYWQGHLVSKLKRANPCWKDSIESAKATAESIGIAGKNVENLYKSQTSRTVSGDGIKLINITDIPQEPLIDAAWLPSTVHSLIQDCPSIDDRQKQILMMRLNNETLHQIGDTLSITKERVRQLESKARVRLQEFILSHKNVNQIRENYEAHFAAKNSMGFRRMDLMQTAPDSGVSRLLPCFENDNERND